MIEQAREVAQRLRNTVLPPYTIDVEAANTIDALVLEVERLTKQCKDYAASEYKTKVECQTLLDQAQADAARYQWLTKSHWYVGPEPEGDIEGVSWCDHNASENGLDAAIDAAREAMVRNDC